MSPRAIPGMPAFLAAHIAARKAQPLPKQTPLKHNGEMDVPIMFGSLPTIQSGQSNDLSEYSLPDVSENELKDQSQISDFNLNLKPSSDSLKT